MTSNKDSWTPFSKRNKYGRPVKPRVNDPIILRMKGPSPKFLMGQYLGDDYWFVASFKKNLTQGEMEEKFSFWKTLKDPGG